jgi:hypothetical protein
MDVAVFSLFSGFDRGPVGFVDAGEKRRGFRKKIRIARPFRLFSAYLCIGKSERPAPAELPQDRKVARVSGCSGAILACFFLPFRVGPGAASFRFWRPVE